MSCTHHQITHVRLKWNDSGWQAITYKKVSNGDHAVVDSSDNPGFPIDISSYDQDEKQKVIAILESIFPGSHIVANPD